MKVSKRSKTGCLCDQCTALCCRYFAFSIDKPKTKRDFDDIRWYLLHGNSLIFVEDGEWYIQINQDCKALLPDNRCGVYENRPAICRSYSTKDCDWHLDQEYDYDQLFTEPDQIIAYGKEYLAKQRKRRLARRKKAKKTKSASRRNAGKKRSVKKKSTRKAAPTLRLRRTA